MSNSIFIRGLALGLGALWLSACGLVPGSPSSAVVPVATQASVATTAPKPAATTAKAAASATKAPTLAPSATKAGAKPTVAPTSTESAKQFGLLGDVQAKVVVKSDPASASHPGVFGESLPVGALLNTDATGGAQVILQNGSTLRLASNTQLTLTDRQQPETGNVLTQFNLLVGKVWAILGRGANESLTIETPIGVGAVRGSYLSVEYIPGKANDLTDDVLIITCLEGDCSLTTSLGTLNLTTGQKITVTGKDSQPVGPLPMTQQDIQDWLDNNVELLILFGVTQGQLPDSRGPITIQIPGGGTIFILPTATPAAGGSTLPTVAPAAGVPWPSSGANGLGALAIVFGGVVMGVAGRTYRNRRK